MSRKYLCNITRVSRGPKKGDLPRSMLRNYLCTATTSACFVRTITKKEGGGHQVREHSSDKNDDTRSADNNCFEYSIPKKKAASLLENQERVAIRLNDYQKKAGGVADGRGGVGGYWSSVRYRREAQDVVQRRSWWQRVFDS